MKKFLLLLSAVCLCITAIILYTKEKAAVTAMAIISSDTEMSVPDSTATDIGTLYAYHFSDGLSNDNSDRINWWYHEDADMYFLFLPSGADFTKIRFASSISDSFYMDETLVQNGSSLPELTSGVHTIFSKDLAKQYTLMILQSANISSLFIETASGNLDYINESKENEEAGHALLMNANGDYEHYGKLEKISGRGNSTWEMTAKRPYQIKFEQGVNIDGLGKAKSWSLLSNLVDSTMLRNAVAFDIAAGSGLAYTPDYTFADLYINHEYKGTYQIFEKIHIDKNRVAIDDLEAQTERVNHDELSSYEPFGDRSDIPASSSKKGFDIENNPSDITGGYIIEGEFLVRYAKEESGFISDRHQPVIIKSPTYASKAQVDYISSLYQEIEDAIFSEDGINPTSGKHYSDYVDIDSFIKKYLVEEITSNPDASGSSQYFYKPSDTISTKLYAGPVWDYDQSLGNDTGDRSNDPNSLYVAYDTGEDGMALWAGLYRHEDYRMLVGDTYETVFYPIINQMITIDIDQKYETLFDSAYMNNCLYRTLNLDKNAAAEAYYAQINDIKNFLYARSEFLLQELSR